mgnify:CR=1 FL=1
MEANSERHFATSDCDVLAEIWVTHALLAPIACLTVLHIKGHTDKKTAYELLALPAQLNVDADKLAWDYMAAHPNKDYAVVPILQTSGIQLHLPAGTITYNTKKEVSMAMTTEPMKQHMIKKHHWEEATFLDIEWEAHRRAANRHHKQRTTLNKHLGNYLPDKKLSRDTTLSSTGPTVQHAALELGLARRLAPIFVGAQQGVSGGNSSCQVCARSWTHWAQR